MSTDRGKDKEDAVYTQPAGFTAAGGEGIKGRGLVSKRPGEIYDSI